jgi:two-component system KDP operon response regulator KdpE
MSADAVILLVEDEADMRALLQSSLTRQGYTCLVASTGTAGIAIARERAPDVVVLDLGLPDVHGVEVIRRIRDMSNVPIVVLSAHCDENDTVRALDAGANDYVTKPFDPGEFLARLRVALRRSGPESRPQATGTVTVGDLCVDFDRRAVSVAGSDVRLTPIEYRLLGVLVVSAGQVVTHQEILRQVWGPRYADHLNYLRIYMRKLRYKIEPEPARPRYLLNELSVGYRLCAPETETAAALDANHRATTARPRAIWGGGARRRRSEVDLHPQLDHAIRRNAEVLSRRS